MTGSESAAVNALRRETTFRYLCALQAISVEAELPLSQQAVTVLREHGPELLADLLAEEELLRICRECFERPSPSPKLCRP